MNTSKWLRVFEPPDTKILIQAAVETASWIETFGHKNNDAEYWDPQPGTDVDDEELLLAKSCLYGGAAGIALFYMRLYNALKDNQYLDHAKAGINYVIQNYKGAGECVTNQTWLPGAYIGYFHGPGGKAYAAKELWLITKEEKYRHFVYQVANDLIATVHQKNDTAYWYGDYAVLAEGGNILFLLDIYKTFQEQRFLDLAVKAGRYIVNQHEEAPRGGWRWYAMPTDTFPTIQQSGGYFPGFEYGAAGCGYICACLYEYTGDSIFLTAAKKAALYIQNIADIAKDGLAALVKYNDTYLTDLYYLGVCQGPVGTSRLFFKLYQLTNENKYRDFVIMLANGLLLSGAPAIHSPGYWHTNCYCCGAPGMLEFLIHIHKMTGESRYLNAALKAASVILGDSTQKNHLRYWYTTWNRHEPWKNDTYTGLYQGSAGCAGSLLALSEYLQGKSCQPAYLEDPYIALYNTSEKKALKEIQYGKNYKKY